MQTHAGLTLSWMRLAQRLPMHIALDSIPKSQGRVSLHNMLRHLDRG